MEERALLRRPGYAGVLGLVSLIWAAAPADARITGLIITTATAPAFAGQSFGQVGQYEQLDGTAFGEIDPHDPLDTVIQDIELAPRNSRGMVEYSMDFSILKPIDTSRGNRTILYDVVNRGNKSSPSLNIGGSATNWAMVFSNPKATRLSGADGKATLRQALESTSRSPPIKTVRKLPTPCAPNIFSILTLPAQ